MPGRRGGEKGKGPASPGEKGKGKTKANTPAKPLTPYRIKRIRYYYRKGASTRDVAEIVGVSRKTVLKYTRDLSPADQRTHAENNRKLNAEIRRIRTEVKKAGWGAPVHPHVVYVRELLGLPPFKPRTLVPAGEEARPSEFPGASQKAPRVVYATSPRPDRLYEAVRLYNAGWDKTTIAAALHLSPEALRGIERYAPNHAENRAKREEEYRRDARYVARRLGIPYREALVRVRDLSRRGLLARFMGNLDLISEVQDEARDMYEEAYDEVEGTWPFA